MKFNRIVRLIWLLIILFTCFWDVNANMLVLEPVNGNFTWKYFCDFDVVAKILYVDNKYNSAMYSIKYDTLKETLTHKSYWSFGEKWFNDLPDQIAWTLYYHLNDQNSFSATRTWSVFSLKWNSTWQTETTLVFVDKNWNNVMNFACGDQSSNLQVVGRVESLAKDCNTLTGTQWITIAYEACPCTLDGDNPIWTWMNSSVNSVTVNLVNNAKIEWFLNVTWLVIDRQSTKSWNYWFSWNAMTHENYISATGKNVDNQFWVDSWTIKVEITYQDPAYWEMSWKSDVYVLWSWLYIDKYVWDNYGNKITWNNNDRWYWINFVNSTWFQVEKQINIKIYAWDNWLNVWSNWLICTHKVNSGKIAEYTFNKAVPPVIQWLFPKTWDTSVNPNLTVSMKLSDTWAGIDTGSLIVWATYPVWSGESDSETWERITKTFEYSWDFFTWWMFKLTGWSEWLWNSWSYVVTFTLTGLTEQTGIILSWYVEDLAGNSTWSQITFETREPCSNFGCRDTFEIKWFDWIDQEWLNKIFPDWTWSVIILVTWSNEISFSWDGNSELMCGWDVEPAYLTWNIKIFDENWEFISEDIDITRKWELYFSWLDVEYDADNNYVNVID